VLFQGEALDRRRLLQPSLQPRCVRQRPMESVLNAVVVDERLLKLRACARLRAGPRQDAVLRPAAGKDRSLQPPHSFSPLSLSRPSGEANPSRELPFIKTSSNKPPTLSPAASSFALLLLLLLLFNCQERAGSRLRPSPDGAGSRLEI
jgi:hypothetical protein